MTIIITIVFVLIAAAVWLLLTPIVIVIDSSAEDYSLSYKPFFSGKFLLNDYDPILRLAYPFGTKDIFLMEQAGSKLKKDTDKKKKIKSKKRRFSLKFNFTSEFPAIVYSFIKALIGKIKIKFLYLNIDTGDQAINGMLHALQAFNGRNVNLAINYMDLREVLVRIEIVPASFIPPVAKLVIDSRKFLRLKYGNK